MIKQGEKPQSRAARSALALLAAAVIVGLFGLTGRVTAGDLPREPLRLAVQAPKAGHEELKDPADRAAQCLALYLHDWLSAAPGVLLMDPEQYVALLDEATDPALRTHPPYGLELFSRYARVDAVVHWSGANGEITCGVCRPGGETTRTFAYGGVRDLPKLLGGVTDWLCTELGMKAGNSPLAKGLMNAEAAALEAAWLTRNQRVVWVNPGTTKLRALRPYAGAAVSNSLVAGAFFRAGTQMGNQLDGNESPAPYLQLLRRVLPFVMGTDQEALALRFLKETRFERGGLEDDLLALVGTAGRGKEEEVLDDLAKPVKPTAIGGEGLLQESHAAAVAACAADPARQAGALRALATMRSKKMMPILKRATAAPDARLRAAAVFAWETLEAPAGNEELRTLAADADASVAFAAASALAARGQRPDRLLDLARAALRADPRCLPALALVAKEGAAADAASLEAAATDPDPARRALALEGLVRLGRLEPTAGAGWLRDPHRDVAKAAIRLLPAGDERGSGFSSMRVQPVVSTGWNSATCGTSGCTGTGIVLKLPMHDALLALANHPDWSVAEVARARLQGMLPADPRERRCRELETEHPYVRRQIVEALAKDGSAPALEDLEAATRNAEPRTRALALQRLADKAPDRARQQLARLVADPHVWVRLHAAAVAALCAGSAETAPLKTALEAETDEVTRLYLQDALARAEGRSAPPAGPPVHRLDAAHNAVLLCGHGPQAPRTPFRGYYDLEVKADDAAKAAYGAGKFFLARVKTARNPAQILLSRPWRDAWWRALDDGLLASLPWLDGVVIGEETMYFRPDNEWDNGWRLFCREAGIDPARVAGRKENLSEREWQAWWNWQQRVAIEGFNTLYDLVKLRYGKLRPGFAVCTFMPQQNGPCDFDRDWKFDIGAGYYYEINNRYRYTQIRRFKTLWPDRPVLWLVNGTSIREARYNAAVPTNALAETSFQPYADGVCAWLAGAHCGQFTAFLFMDKDTKSGPTASGKWVFPEEVYPGSPTLAAGTAHAFRGVEDMRRTQAEIKALKPGLDLAADRATGGDDVALDAVLAKARDRFAVQTQADMKRLETGFLLDAKMAQDTARVLDGLPFPAPARKILLIGDTSASKGALRLPNEYDALDSIGKCAGQDLASYRLIAVADSDQALLRDDAMTNVTAWLRTQPGLLYVHGWLSTTGTNEIATPGDLDGRLDQAWPWASDVSFDGKQYRIEGAAAALLDGEAADLSPKLVFWRREGFRGGVLFDATDLSAAALRDRLNGLAAERNVGIRLDGPTGMERGSVSGLVASVACRTATEPFTQTGVDGFTGAANPTLGMGRGAAMVADSYQGRYTATFNGVTVLADRPLEFVEPVANGLRVRCAGLMRAAGRGGAVTVDVEGARPPAIPEGEAMVEWIVYKETPGIAEVKRRTSETLTYVRAAGIVTFRGAPGVAAGPR